MVSCNQQFATLAGLSADGAVGRRLDDLIAVTEPAGTGRLLAISRGKGHPRGPGAAQLRAQPRHQLVAAVDRHGAR